MCDNIPIMEILLRLLVLLLLLRGPFACAAGAGAVYSNAVSSEQEEETEEDGGETDEDDSSEDSGEDEEEAEELDPLADDSEMEKEIIRHELATSEKVHIHNYVDRLLGTSNIDEVSPERLSEASVTMQVHNLQKNMDALQLSLLRFEEAQKSKKSKANMLYTRIKSAFSEYFNGDLPDKDEVKVVEKIVEKCPSAKKAKSGGSAAEKGSAPKIYTVKKNAEMKNSYLGNTKKYSLRKAAKTEKHPAKNYKINRVHFPTKTYGKAAKFPERSYGKPYPTKTYEKYRKTAVKTNSWPTKNYGKRTVATTAKRYFKKKCCGK